MRVRPFVPHAASGALVLSLGASAHALPSPLSDQELLDQSDLVVDGSVTEAACDGPATATTSTYVSKVAVDTTVKGTAPADLTVVGFVEKNGANCAAVTPALEQGFSGRLYLVQSTSGGTYQATYWNGFKADANSAPQALPDCAAGGAAGAGTGGASTGGSAGSSTGTGGASASGSGDDGGCSTAPGGSGSSAPWLALGAAVAAALRRRRASR